MQHFPCKSFGAPWSVPVLNIFLQSLETVLSTSQSNEAIISLLEALSEHQEIVHVSWLQRQREGAMKTLKPLADGDVAPLMRATLQMDGISSFVGM